MNSRWPLVLVFAFILLLQLGMATEAIAWYPDVVARVLASRDAANPLGWSLLVTLVVVSPLVLLVAPYSIANAAWRAFRQPSRRIAV
jgi:hypothetical protein